MDFRPRTSRRYRCVEPGRSCRHEAIDGAFAADIDVDADGLVAHFPGLFEHILIV